MALVRRLLRTTMDRNVVHGSVDCTYGIFSDSSDSKYLQINTYGSDERKLKGKKSQSIQFDRESLKELKAIISEVV